MAYLNETSAAPIKLVTVQSALEDFDPVLSRLEALVGRMTNCGDRIVGSRPSEVSAQKDNPSPAHLIYGIQSRRERLVRAVNEIETETQRIENGLA